MRTTESILSEAHKESLKALCPDATLNDKTVEQFIKEFEIWVSHARCEIANQKQVSRAILRDQLVKLEKALSATREQLQALDPGVRCLIEITSGMAPEIKTTSSTYGELTNSEPAFCYPEKTLIDQTYRHTLLLTAACNGAKESLGLTGNLREHKQRTPVFYSLVGIARAFTEIGGSIGHADSSKFHKMLEIFYLNITTIPPNDLSKQIREVKQHIATSPR